MIAWLKAFFRGPPTKRARPSHHIPLIFKDARSCFEYQCKFGRTVIVRGEAIVALVEDARVVADRDLAVTVTSYGQQVVSILVASPEGGWQTVSPVGTGSDEPLAPGDLVAWMPVSKMDVPLLDDDDRTRWVGAVVAKLAPEIHADGLRIVTRY